MNSEQRFVWCDLEMTGLDTSTNVIIEMGLVITGPDLKPIAEWETAVWQPSDALDRIFSVDELANQAQWIGFIQGAAPRWVTKLTGRIRAATKKVSG